MAELSDTEAIRCCQSNGADAHSAFRSLYKRYLPLARSYASRMVRSLALDEVVQETFVRLYKSRNSIDPERPLKPYVLRIAHNAALDELRRSKKTERLSDRDQDSLSQQDASLRSDLAEAMNLALANLEPVYRAVVLLRHEQKLTFSELADVLDCSESTARNRLMTAVILLEKSLRRVGVFEEGDES